MKLPKLYIEIEIEDGEVTGVWYTDENGQDRLLNEGSDYRFLPSPSPLLPFNPSSICPSFRLVSARSILSEEI